MLARANRVIRPDEFRVAVRRGRRMSTAHAVLYLFPRQDAAPTRFGFIVSKAVGVAVVRNRVRRRLRAIARELLVARPTGTDVVIRALPGIDALDWQALHDEVTKGFDRAVDRMVAST
ncbi:ribonuclease P protein component [Ruicaihuangia caeni]|uniref:Ribonuclease P protein component n=1 Tax=Ruicaihuangia caeni TaxID=3042517 RepID=A0AAW6TCL6_9MICO|nr:ribonuclease P protein component [Klugiella sp. YN-L-19]MDI2099120.1 ribonuclease P protein component [Klugiella sp. YN-L-19]